MNPDRKDCVGCKGLFQRGKNCMVEPKLSDDDLCPCLHCLVKVTCHMVCDPFIDYMTRSNLDYKIN